MVFADIVLGAALGGLVGFLMSIPAIIVEWRDKKNEHNLPILVDIKASWWRGFTNRELFLFSLLQHLVFATLFGLIYVIFVQQGWLFITNSPYSFWSLIAYAIGAWIVIGFTLFPLTGFGFFGKKEGNLVWAEVLTTMFILGIAIWLLVQWFQPAYFNI